jgi:hypothetical protein
MDDIKETLLIQDWETLPLRQFLPP